jgi:uncharacterized protein
MKEYSKNMIKALHQKYAIIPFPDKAVDLVWTHSQIVMEIARQLARNYAEKSGETIDYDLIKTGALVHDIGSYKCFGDKKYPYILHGIFGREILLNEGYSPQIADCAASHVGVGITTKEIKERKMPLPIADYLPQTLEEELICYADKFHSKSPKFDEFTEIEAEVKKYGREPFKRLIKLHDKFGLPDLTVLKEKYSKWHKKTKELLDTTRV